MENPIKWSGSKRLLANQIISHFPEGKTGKFYELFCGGCSITLELILKYPDKAREYENIICVDNNEDLMHLWNYIKRTPNLLIGGYERLWKDFKQRQEETIEGHRKFYFNYIRNEFNSKLHSNLTNSIYFLFLLRTSFSGLVRYNSSGVYNSSCHFTRPGIHPDKMKKIIIKASELLNEYNVLFLCGDYKDFIPDYNDFVFMDPPYSSVGNSKGKKSMYHGGINTNELIEYCNNLKCDYALTFDGDRGENKANKISLNGVNIVNLEKKNSSYSRLNGKQVEVEEIMYIKK